MEKCPRCNKYSVSYDSSRGENMCLIDGCTTYVIDKDTYSYLKINPVEKTINRIKVVNGIEKEIIKSYKLQI